MVEPVHDPPVAGDDVTEVLDLEGALEATGEEAAEGIIPDRIKTRFFS